MENLDIQMISGDSKSEIYNKVEGFVIGATSRSNCTKDWKAAGSPTVGSSQFTEFCEKMLSRSTKGLPGLGCYIVLENCVPNTRKHPVGTVTIPRPTHKQKYVLVHHVFEAEFDLSDSKKGPVLTGINLPLWEFDYLVDAKKAARRYTELTGKSCIVRKAKVPTEQQDEFYTFYQPSVRAHKGSYVAFGIKK